MFSQSWGSQHAHVPPVIILPISYFLFKERIGWQGIVGTMLAIVGVAVLFLV
jgi:drug/metabolite transporter (DMT)-like permease